MPSFFTTCAGLCLTLGLAGAITAAEPLAALADQHYHLRSVATNSKAGYVMRSVACTEAHPAPPTAPEHTHRWYKSGDKRPGQWITETCTLFHSESPQKICPLPSPKGSCAHKPHC